MSNSTAPKWYIGLVLLVAAIVFLIFIATPMQFAWGMWGLALTEIGLLAIALIPPFIFKWKLSDMLPIKKITGKQFGATILLYMATFIVMTTVTLITAYFFPAMLDVGSALSSFFTTVPFILALFIVAVMPAVCEEVLFRGAILHTFKSLKNEWVVMFIVAFFFGLFHLDAYRFLPTAIIGFVVTYLMIKTGNILLPMLYHFVNNAISVSSGFLFTGDSVDTSAETMAIGLGSIGIYLIFSAAAPPLYYCANMLLAGKGKNMKGLVIALIISGLLFAAGVVIFAVALSNGLFDDIMNMM